MATITKRGNSYRIRVYNGYDISGKQIERTMTWTPPASLTQRQAEKEAQRQAILFEERIRSSNACDGRIRFDDFSQLWLKHHAEPNLRPRTIARYRELLEPMLCSFGHKPLEQITPMIIMEFYGTLQAVPTTKLTPTVDLRAKLKQLGMTKVAFSKASNISLTTIDTICHRRTVSPATAAKVSATLGGSAERYFTPTKMPTKTLSSTTIQHYHRLLSSILGTAVKWQYLVANPCSRVSPPKAERPKIEILDDVEIIRFCQKISTQPGHYRRPVLLLLLTGLRRSELLGLEWQDIDWEAQTITISRTSQWLPGQGVFADQTKNRSSERTIPISAQAIDILREQYAWQLIEQARLKNKWTQSGRIVTTRQGKPMNPNTLSHWFGEFIRRSDLPDIHLHSLRHTYATICISKGVAIPAISRQLGHADSTTTCKIYAHAIKSAQCEANDAIGDIVKEALSQQTAK